MSVISNVLLINTEVINGKEIKIYSGTIVNNETYSCYFNDNVNVNLTMFCIYAMDGYNLYTGTIHWPFNNTSNSENINTEDMSSEEFINKYTTTDYTDDSYDDNKNNFIKRNATLFAFCLTGIIFETEKSNEEEEEDQGITVSGHIAFKEFPDYGINFQGVTPKIIYKGNVIFDTYCPILNEQICEPKCETIRYNTAMVMCIAVNYKNDSYVWNSYPYLDPSVSSFNTRKEVDKWIINKNLEYDYSINYTKAEERDFSSGFDNESFFTEHYVIIQKDEEGNEVIVKFHKEKKDDKDVIFDVNGTKTVIIEEGCILECDKFKC